MFDIFGNIRKASDCEPLKVTQKEAWNGTLRKFKSYQMGMQVSCGLDSEMPEESSIWTASKGFGTNSPKAGIAQGE